MSQLKTRRRRKFQVSLRWFLLCVTLFCFWLGRIVESAYSQREVVIAIGRMGGDCYYDFGDGVGKSRFQNYVQQRLGEDLFCNVVAVVFRQTHVRSPHHLVSTDDLVVYSQGGEVRDADLAILASLPHLRLVDLSFTDVGDECLKHLVAVPSLQKLKLRGTRISQAGLGRLRRALSQCIIEQ